MITRFVASNAARLYACANPGQLVVSVSPEAVIIAAFEEDRRGAGAVVGRAHRVPAVHGVEPALAAWAVVVFDEARFPPWAMDAAHFVASCEARTPEEAVPALRRCIAEILRRRDAAEAERAPAAARCA